MTYSEWISATACESREAKRLEQPTDRRRFPWAKNHLKAFDKALLAYEQLPSRATFEAALEAFNAWLQSPEYAEIDQNAERRTLMESPVKQMSKWFKIEARRLTRLETRLEHRGVLSAFSLAAQTLIDRFPTIPDVYKNALQETFLQSADSSEELYCIKWYPGLEEWRARVTELGDDSSAAQTADAFTVSWAVTDAHLCKTEHKYQHAPFNRGIEFHTPSKDSFIHELLHWCTHEYFKNHIETTHKPRTPEYNFLKEGLTEWLKRYATGDPSKGGYPEQYKDAVNVAKRVGITELELAKAYLEGHEVEAMIGKLVQGYKSVLGDRMAAKLGPSLTYDKAMYDNVLDKFRQKQAKGKLARPDVDKKFTEAMYAAFRAQNLDHKAITENTNEAWADGYDKWPGKTM